MKKTLIALAVLGATAGVAHAQSNVTIYGIVDGGFIKEEGSKVFMNEKVNNRIGFRGVEDLGGGIKATFGLEKRFDIFNGGPRGSGEFDGEASVGLAGGFGAVRIGKMNELSTETLRTLDPFNQYGVGGMFETPLRRARIESSVRYDSPNFAGFSFGLTYSLENQTGDPAPNDAFDGTTNAGYAASVKYMNGPVVALANYNRAYNSGDSYNWNVGGAYAFGPAKVSLAYEKTRVTTEGATIVDDEAEAVFGDAGDYKNWLVGVSYKIGSGTINASYNRLKSDVAAGDFKDQKIALGYTHDLSKRTSVYLDVARTKIDDERAGVEDDTINAIQVGVTHKF